MRHFQHDYLYVTLGTPNAIMAIQRFDSADGE